MLALLLVCTALLACIGLSVIDLAEHGRSYWPGLVQRQVRWLALGVCLAALCAVAPSARLRAAVLPVSAALLLAIVWGSMGSHSTSLRALPLLLLTLTLPVAALVAGEQSSLRQGLLWLTLVGVGLALVTRRPSPLVAVTSASAVALAIGCGARWSWRGWAAVALVGVSLGFYSLHMPSYQLARLRSWLAPDPLSDGYLVHQYRRLLGEAGTWGSPRGWPSTTPDAVMDAPFVVWAHQSGIAGAALLVGLYLALLGVAVYVARRSAQPFHRALGRGIAAFWGLHLLLSVGGNLGLVPATSVSLPLIGYGGSGALAALACVGLLLHVLLQGEVRQPERAPA